MFSKSWVQYTLVYLICKWQYVIDIWKYMTKLETLVVRSLFSILIGLLLTWSVLFDFDTTANYCKSDFKTHLWCFCGFKRERESPISWRKILWTHWLIRPTTIVLTLSYCASGNASSSHEMVGNYTLYKWVKIRKKNLC